MPASSTPRSGPASPRLPVWSGLPKTVGIECGGRRLIATSSIALQKVVCLAQALYRNAALGLHTIYTRSPSVHHT